MRHARAPRSRVTVSVDKIASGFACGRRSSAVHAHRFSTIETGRGVASTFDTSIWGRFFPLASRFRFFLRAQIDSTICNPVPADRLQSSMRYDRTPSIRLVDRLAVAVDRCSESGVNSHERENLRGCDQAKIIWQAKRLAPIECGSDLGPCLIDRLHTYRAPVVP